MSRTSCRKAQLFLLVFGILVLCHRLGLAQTVDDTAGTLAQACEIAANYPSPEAIQKSPALEKSDVFKATYCYGYFAGVLDSNLLYSGMSRGIFCAPKTGLSANDAINIFLKYVQDSPQHSKEKSISIVVSSLADVLPCQR